MRILEINHINKTFEDGTKALDQFQLSIEEGQVLSIIGESGSGKSTLLRALAGLETLDSGEIILQGEKILGPNEKLVAGYEEIQLVHQQFKLYPNSTVEENIARPLLLFDKDYTRERLDTLLELFQLFPMKDRLPKQLSGGQQQKVAIARALSLEPKLLLMDEPFSQLDPIQKRDLLEELRGIFASLSTTVIWVTHDLLDALAISEHLCVMRNGRPIQLGTASELYRQPCSLYVAALFSPINKIPSQNGHYVRSGVLKLHRNNAHGRVMAQVVSARFLPMHNLIKAQLHQNGGFWMAEDPSRAFKVGDTVFLSFPEEEIMEFNE
jgi:ABC-type sugar transport system ATPase subunit